MRKFLICHSSKVSVNVPGFLETLVGTENRQLRTFTPEHKQLKTINRPKAVPTVPMRMRATSIF